MGHSVAQMHHHGFALLRLLFCACVPPGCLRLACPKVSGTAGAAIGGDGCRRGARGAAAVGVASCVAGVPADIGGGVAAAVAAVVLAVAAVAVLMVGVVGATKEEAEEAAAEAAATALAGSAAAAAGSEGSRLRKRANLLGDSFSGSMMPCLLSHLRVVGESACAGSKSSAL